jgi:hypothetical protein
MTNKEPIAFCLRARKTQGGKTACKVAAILIFFLGLTF